MYFTWIYLLQDLIRKLEKNLFLQNCKCNFSFFSNWYWCVCTSSQLLSSYHFVVQEFLCFLIKLLILPLKYLFCHSWHTFHCFPWAEVGISLYDLLPLHRVVGGERGTSVIIILSMSLREDVAQRYPTLNWLGHSTQGGGEEGLPF